MRSSFLLKIALGVWFWLVVLFLFAPLFVVVLFSFNTTEISVLPMRGFTLDWYSKLFQNGQIGDALLNSLIVAVLTVVMSVTLGVAFAIGVSRRRGPLSRVLLGLAAAPMIMPRLIIGVGLLTMIDVLGLRLSLWTVLLGHTLIGIPYVVLIVNARMASFDHGLEEAARDLGAGFITVLRTVTLPLLRPAIIGAALIAFTESFDDPVISFFTIGIENTLPILLWGLLRYGITPEVNALASVTLLISLLTAIAAEVVLRLNSKDASNASNR